MRSIGIFGTVLAMGLSLAACSGQRDADADARATQQAGPAARDAMPASAGTSSGRARFAALPDRGELLRYDAQAAVRDGAYTWHRTELSERHAIDAVASGMLRVTTPDGRVLGFRYDRSVRHDNGDWTWIGHLPGEEGAQAILTFGAGAAYGSIGQPGARPLRLAMRGGASWLVETDPSKLAGLASRAANPEAPDYRIVSPAAIRRLLESRTAASSSQSAGLAPKAASATTAATTVDLVIGYTQGFVNAHGGSTNALTRLNSIVDTANAGLANSQVSGQIRLVHALQVNYTDTNTNDAALGQLTGYDSDTQQETTPNAAFNALRAAREQYGADLVSLVRPFKEPEQDSCGIAWLIGGGKQAVTATNGWDYFGYSVVSDGTDRNEQDGRTYFCEEHTLAHELGHNMGSQHDRETSKGDDGVLDDPDDYGAFSYSFGYKPAAFYTIMAYGDSGQTSYLTFSNPRTTFCGGATCGVNNSEDNAKSLGLVMPAVAGFRSEATTQARYLLRQLDANGDGLSDLMFFDHAGDKITTWFMNGVQRLFYSSNGMSGALSLVDAGDFDGNGRSDLLFQDPQSRHLFMALSTGSSYAVHELANVYSSNLGPVAAGDINGDGNADVILRDRSDGDVVVWYMSGVTRLSYSVHSFAGARQYDFVGVGDLDGDGKQDLLWNNAGTRQLLASISTGTGFSNHDVGLTYQTGHAPAGLQDINGDGDADIVFVRDDDRRMVVWFMHGATRFTYVAKVLDAAYKLVGKGDFDGNGRGDLVFSNPGTREIKMLLSGGVTFVAGYVSVVPQAGMDLMDVDL